MAAFCHAKGKRYSQSRRPHTEDWIAAVVGRGPSAHRRRGENFRLTEVLGDDAAVVLVGRVEPAADGLGREHAVAERTDEPAFRPQDASDVPEHVDRPGEVVDGHTADGVVDALVAEG